jgi:tetratricopeptide (TPR) repeat protein
MRQPPWLALGVFAAGVLAGVTFLRWRGEEPKGAKAPPAITFASEADGVRVARIDVTALAAWCARHDLPEPPAIERMEGVLAEHFGAALGAAARPSAEALGQLGRIYESLDAHRAAGECFALAREKDPKELRWVYHLGCVHQVTGRRSEAIRTFEDALEVDPSYPVTWARLATLYLEEGRRSDARRAFEHYVELRPNDWLGHAGLGRLELEAGSPEKALAHLERAERLGPNDFQVNYYLGRTYSALGRRDLAQAHLARARELPQGAYFALRDSLDQELDRVGSSVASLQAEFRKLSESQDWPRLTRIAEEILSRRANDVTTMGNLAGIYRKMKRFDKAHALLDRAAERGGGTPSLRILNLRAEVFLAQEKFDSAIAAAESVLSLEEGNARAHAVKARSLLMLERYAEAEASMRRALRADSSEGTNWFVLGEALLAQSETSEAKEAFESALARLPSFAPAQRRIEEIKARKP